MPDARREFGRPKSSLLRNMAVSHEGRIKVLAIAWVLWTRYMGTLETGLPYVRSTGTRNSVPQESV